MTRQRAILLVFTGLVAGLLSGLLGVAGGVVIVPALTSRRVGLDRSTASGTSIAAVLPIAVVGMLIYGLYRNVDAAAALAIIPAAVFGAAVGSRLAPHLPTATLRHAFHLLLTLTALRMLIALPQEPSERIAITATAVLALCAVGVGSGVVSGLLGSGGGTIIVPALVVLFGLAQAQAQGTSLLAIIPMCLGGVVVHSRQGTLRTNDSLIVGIAGTATVGLGAMLAAHVAADPLRTGFAAFLLLTVVVGLSRVGNRENVGPDAAPEPPRSISR